MRRYLMLLLTVTFLLAGGMFFVHEDALAAEFDDASVIVVTKPVNNISVFSLPYSFDELGIAKIENLDKTPVLGISTFGLYGTQTLKLTLETPGTQNVLETIDKLNAMPNIEFAQPNYIYTLFDMPDDPYYINGSQYGLDKIGAPAVWDLDIDGSDVVVAIIDTGITMNHPDLVDNIWTNPGEIPDNGIDDDGNGFIDDVHGWDFVDNDNIPNDEQGHGTHVAGIISASTNNGIGVASLARNVKVVPLKIFASRETTDEYVYQAIEYANAMGFPIINNSYGEDEPSELLQMAVERCTDALFVAAAGNESTDNGTKPIYPASCDVDNVIAVASVDKNDKLSSFSNYGLESVDIAAPGTSIYSTYKNASGYTSLSGTSMACPMVTGAAALVKAVNPDLTPAEIIKILETTADPLPSLSGKLKTGARLNAFNAVSAASPVIMQNGADVTRDGNRISVTLNISGGADDNDIIIFAAARQDGFVKKVIMPEVIQAASEFTVPDDMADAEITLYVWDRNYKPYMSPIPVENASE